MLQYCLEFDDPNEGFRGSDTVYGWFINCHFLNFEFGLRKKKREGQECQKEREKYDSRHEKKRERGEKGKLTREIWKREREDFFVFTYTLNTH